MKHDGQRQDVVCAGLALFIALSLVSCAGSAPPKATTISSVATASSGTTGEGTTGEGKTTSSGTTGEGTTTSSGTTGKGTTTSKAPSAVQPAAKAVPEGLVGGTEADAKAALDASGIKYTLQTQEVPAGDDRVGNVVSVDPKAGTKLTEGQSVTLTIATEAATTSAKPSQSHLSIAKVEFVRDGTASVTCRLQVIVSNDGPDGAAHGVLVTAQFETLVHPTSSAYDDLDGPSDVNVGDQHTYISGTFVISPQTPASYAVQVIWNDGSVESTSPIPVYCSS